MWLNGTSTGSLAKDGMQRLTSSPEVSKLVAQAGQPLVQAARNAAVAAVEARLSGLAAGINQRTSRLLPQGPGEGKEPDAEGDEPEGAESMDTKSQDAEPDGDQSAQQRGGTESPDEDDRDDRAESEMDTGPAPQSKRESASEDSGDEPDDDEEPAAAREGRPGKPPETRKAPARGARTGSTRQREKAAS
jgi:hypothetical protein